LINSTKAGARNVSPGLQLPHRCLWKVNLSWR